MTTAILGHTLIHSFYQMTQTKQPFFQTATVATALFRIAGIPPTVGFLGKLVVIQRLIWQNQYLLSLLMLIFSIFIFFMYLRIVLNFFIANSQSTLLTQGTAFK